MLNVCVRQWISGKRRNGLWFQSLHTPSENLCDRFCRLDTAEFGVVPGVTDKGYYTNSFHLDVEKKVNPYDKIDFEAPYPPLANGGFICYGEYPNISTQPEGAGRCLGLQLSACTVLRHQYTD
ncbi:anaerobic ribonucleoside-triphosphate reductase [Escherichia coli]